MTQTSSNNYWVKLGVAEVYGGHAYAEVEEVVDEEAIVPK